jgi:SAM-dependent methyltransferase
VLRPLEGTGSLVCTALDCGQEYPVIEGIPILARDVRSWIRANHADLLARHDLANPVQSLIGDCLDPTAPFNLSRQHLSIYAADHYGTGTDRPAGGSVHDLLAAGLAHCSALPDGAVLDLGCAVGGTTFALARHFPQRPVLGLDLSWSMLRLGREALDTGAVTYPLREVGLVYESCTRPVERSGARPAGFWLADAIDPPLPPESAALIVALNLLDCVNDPPGLLRSIAALLVPGGMCLLATPFDWSANATPIEGWIGGHSQRAPDGGRAEPRFRTLLESTGLRLECEENHSWSLRLHARSRVSYDSALFVLRKPMVEGAGA